MKIKNSQKTVIIALLLIITIAIPISASSAAVPIHHKATHAYIGATPKSCWRWTTNSNTYRYHRRTRTCNYGWEGLTVKVTKPDNTTETIGPFRTDATGGTGTAYTPTITGTYYLETNFPAQWFNWTTSGGADIYYEASTSSKLALVVQEEQLSYWQSSPLPSRILDSPH